MKKSRVDLITDLLQVPIKGYKISVVFVLENVKKWKSKKSRHAPQTLRPSLIKAGLDDRGSEHPFENRRPPMDDLPDSTENGVFSRGK